MDIKTDNHQVTENKKNTPALPSIRTQGEKKDVSLSVLIDLRARINALVNTNSLCNGA